MRVMIHSALRNPYLVVVILLAVFVLGTVSYQNVPADLLPIFKTPAVQIVTFYPGMPPEVMERDIMSRLERWTGQSVGIEHQEAKAMLGVCVVKDFFREDISLETAMSQVTSYAMSDMFYLPPGTIPPMVMPFDPTASVPLCLVSVSNPEMDEKELYDIAYYDLRNQLQAIQGVIAPAVYGGKLRRIIAYVDRDKLLARGLSLMDVQEALLRQSVLIPAGNAKMGETDFQIFTNAIPRHVEELNNVPIKVVDGAPILVRDVGEVRDSNQIQSNIVRMNGSRQAYIPIYRQPGANTIEIVDAINQRLERILDRLKSIRKSDDPRMEQLVLSVAMDQSKGVRTSIRGLQVAVGAGGLLAGLVVLVFLGNIRSTLVVMMAIPLAILAAIIGLFYSGDTINAMTLGGLALAVGILVDQSIVVLENIIRHVHMGKTPFDAALDGTREVALPIFVATITFCIVFYPVVFLSGLAKFLFTPLAVSATIAILASYLIAITLVPAYCARFVRFDSSQVSENHFFDRLSDRYVRVLDYLSNHRKVVVLFTFVVVGIAILGVQTIGQELFPSIDSGQFTMTVRLPSGTRIERTEATIREIEKVVIAQVGQPDPGYSIGVEQHPESNLQMLISNIGVLMDWPAAYTPNSGPMDAFMLVQLKQKTSLGNTRDYVTTLRRDLTKQFPEVEFAFDTGGMMTAALNMGEPSPVHFQVRGSNLKTAQEIARLIKHEAAQVPGTADVRIAQRIDYPILNVEMDRILAAQQGVTVENVMKNMVSATNSSINFEPTFWIDENNGNHYFMGVQYEEDAIRSLDTLRDVPITGEFSKQPTLLRNVAKIEQALGPAVINHRNITRATDVYANILPGYDVGSVVRDVEKRLENNVDLALRRTQTERGEIFEVAGADSTPDDHRFKGGYVFDMQGEVRSMRESFRQFSMGLIISTLLVYLALVAQFRSFVDPFVILVTIPMGFVGVAIMLLLTQTPFSIQVFMGLIMMVGIVVEYSIILIDFANRRVAAGLSVNEAIVEASRTRLRPILMTSITTWLALLPMAMGWGGGEANIPLARTIISGVIGATVLSLFVVPCLYLMVKRSKQVLPGT